MVVPQADLPNCSSPSQQLQTGTGRIDTPSDSEPKTGDLPFEDCFSDQESRRARTLSSPGSESFIPDPILCCYTNCNTAMCQHSFVEKVTEFAEIFRCRDNF